MSVDRNFLHGGCKSAVVSREFLPAIVITRGHRFCARTYSEQPSPGMFYGNPNANKAVPAATATYCLPLIE